MYATQVIIDWVEMLHKSGLRTIEFLLWLFDLLLQRLIWFSGVLVPVFSSCLVRQWLRGRDEVKNEEQGCSSRSIYSFSEGFASLAPYIQLSESSLSHHHPIHLSAPLTAVRTSGHNCLIRFCLCWSPLSVWISSKFLVSWYSAMH